MKPQYFFIIFLTLIITGFCSISYGNEKVYRIGVPKGYNSPMYHRLFEALPKQGLELGRNLKIVPINITGFSNESDKKKIRQEIAEKTDLFFSTCDYIGMVFELKLKTPFLFVGIMGMDFKIPPSMRSNATGFFRGSAVTLFQQTMRILPKTENKKLGLIYRQNSSLNKLIPEFNEIGKKHGINLIAKEYISQDGIEPVMRAFKQEEVNSILLFPPGIKKKDLAELIKWQNQLKLPIIGQTRANIEKGLLGGQMINYELLTPDVANYAAKILRGRLPGKLPVKYYASKYIINLTTATQLGVTIPPNIIEAAEITGIAGKSSVKKKNAVPLLPGKFVIGTPKSMPKALQKAILKAMEARGYVKGKNLELAVFNINRNSHSINAIIAKQISDKTNLFFSIGNTLPILASFPSLKVPVCFLSTKEIIDNLPAKTKNHFTGVIRASSFSIIERALNFISGAKKVGILTRKNEKLPLLVQTYQKIAKKYDIDITFLPFTQTHEIGVLMRENQQNLDFILLYPPLITNKDIQEIVKWQNRLNLPVLGQFKRHIEAGLLGGSVIDFDKVGPKLAEYMDKLLQGRSPSKLPIYYFQGKYVINLRASDQLRQRISHAITTQADIIR